MKDIKEFFSLLFSQEAKEAWQEYLQQFEGNYEVFWHQMERNLSEEELMRMFRIMLMITGKGLFPFERRVRLFELAESMGMHIMPDHFYEPVPNTLALNQEAWQVYDARGMELDGEKQLDLLREMAEFIREMEDTPHEMPAAGCQYYFNSPSFCPTDAVFYYAVLRYFRPQRVFEIGCGHSTLVAARAAAKNGGMELTCVEPYPAEYLKKDLGISCRLIIKKVQELPLDTFQQLQANDVLFIDSSHVSKIGSDVNYLLLRVLPLLNPGVIVHFHDIFLPDEYPEHWIKEKKIFWNEQYLLHAFMLFNADYEVLLANHYLGKYHKPQLQRLMPKAPSHGGGSFWIRRKVKARQ